MMMVLIMVHNFIFFFHQNLFPSGNCNKRQIPAIPGCKARQSLWCWSADATRAHTPFAFLIAGTTRTQYGEFPASVVDSRSTSPLVLQYKHLTYYHIIVLVIYIYIYIIMYATLKNLILTHYGKKKYNPIWCYHIAMERAFS